MITGGGGETRIRLYVEGALAAGACVEGRDGQAHYLRSVMRLAEGAEVRLFNGRDGEWLARVARLAKNAVSFEALERLRPQAPEPDVRLLFAAVKRGPVDLIAEKATELGAARLSPVFTRRTVAARVNVERLAAIAVEAAEQCGRLTVPAVDEAEPLERALAAWDPARPLVLADESGAAPPVTEALGALKRGVPCALLIGPEGGFAPEELDRLRTLTFVTPVALGPRILRAETAAIAALACIQALAGDWR